MNTARHGQKGCMDDGCAWHARGRMYTLWGGSCGACEMGIGYFLANTMNLDTPGLDLNTRMFLESVTWDPPGTASVHRNPRGGRPFNARCPSWPSWPRDASRA
jgi:hypothetical protein